MRFAKTHILRGIFPHARAPPVKLQGNFTYRVFYENSQIIVYEIISSATEVSSARRMKMDSGRIPFLAGGCFLERLKV